MGTTPNDIQQQELKKTGVRRLAGMSIFVFLWDGQSKDTNLRGG